MNLLDAMQKEYSMGKKRLYFWGTILSVFSYILALISAFNNYFFSLVIAEVLLSIALFLFKLFASFCFSNAEEIRRILMLEDGLGVSPPSSKIKFISERLHKKINKEPPFQSPYYASKKAKGHPRLLDIIHESAFFTGRQAKYVFQIYLIASMAGAVVFLLSFAAILQVSNSVDAALIISKVIIAGVSLFFTSDLVEKILSFYGLWKKSDEIFTEIDAVLKNPGHDELEQEALIMFAEYNCALAKSLPIPSFVYQLRKEAMNEAWNKII